MTIKKFLTSVADFYFYDESDNLLALGKTLLDTTLDVKLASTDVRGGRGNARQYIYYHTNEMTVQLNDVQWNLAALAANVGETLATGSNVYTTETVTLGASGSGSVTGTPIAIQGTTIYGWITHENGNTERVTFSSQSWSSSAGTSGDVVCVRYYHANAATNKLTIPSNVIPKIGRLVLEAQLNSSDQASNKIGIVQVIIPKFTLSGSFTLNLKADGYSNTPLSGTALAYKDSTTASCTSEDVYAEIHEILDSANWYDGLIAISVSGGNFSLATTLGTQTLVVYGIKSDLGSAPFVIPNSELSFTSGTTGVATAGLHTGLITGVSAGTSLITVVVDDANTIETQVTVTVPS